MSSFGSARPFINMLALALVLAFGLVPVSVAQAQSSAQDRARFVSITRQLEATPLQADSRADREWALQWLTEVPDVSVTICMTSLGNLGGDYRYGGEVALQYVFAMAVQVIEHPETASDQNALQLAGAEGALRAYRSILGREPEAKSDVLDSLLETEAGGGLQAMIVSNSASCSA